MKDCKHRGGCGMIQVAWGGFCIHRCGPPVRRHPIEQATTSHYVVPELKKLILPTHRPLDPQNQERLVFTVLTSLAWNLYSIYIDCLENRWNAQYMEHSTRDTSRIGMLT